MGESSLIHLGLIKTRAVGTGQMGVTVSTFDNLNIITYPNLGLTPTNKFLLQRLTNYIGQGIKYKFAATTIDDSVRVQDITLFVKPIYTEIPM